MIWDFLNAMFHALLQLKVGVLSGLPVSPLVLSDATAAALSTVAGYGQFFFPIHEAIQLMGATLIALGVAMAVYWLWRLYSLLGNLFL